jgi:hypothetical protein
VFAAHRTRVGGAALVALCAGLAGCGGAIKDEELRRGVETLQSDAAEGALLARGVAQNRTRSTFVRVHARALSEDADHEAEKLHDADARPELLRQKTDAVRLATDVSDALGKLIIEPGDEAAGRKAEHDLNALAQQAKTLADHL